MKRDRRIKHIKKLLTARGVYDETPDTNIERLSKEIVDIAVTKKPELVKTIEKKKRDQKEKPIRTSLLCSRR